MIERNSAIPLYYQIQEYLRNQIDSAVWKPGDQIPTEQQLCDRFGVSRITVVKALTRLVEEGVLVREQGKGTFVATPTLVMMPPKLLSFTEDMQTRGLAAGTEILSTAVQPCPPKLVQTLGLNDGDVVWIIERLRTANGGPMGIQRAYLSQRRFPNLGELLGTDVSLYRILAKHYGAYPARAMETYSAVELTATEATVLQQEPGRPAFAVQRTTWDTTGGIIEYVRSVMRNDKYHYTVELERTNT